MNVNATRDIARAKAAHEAGAISARDLRDMMIVLCDGVTNKSIDTYLSDRGF